MITIHPDQSVSINAGLGVEEFKVLNEVSEFITSRDKQNKFVLPTYGTFTFICKTDHGENTRGLKLLTQSSSDRYPIPDVDKELFKIFLHTGILEDNIPRVLQIVYDRISGYRVMYWIGAHGIEKSHFAPKRLNALAAAKRSIESVISEFESGSRNVLVNERVNMEGVFRVDRGGHGNYQIQQKVDNVWKPFNPWPGVGVAGSIPGSQWEMACSNMYSVFNTLENMSYLDIQLFKGMVGIEFDCTAVYRDHRGTHCLVKPRIVLTPNLPLELTPEEYGVEHVYEVVI